MKLLNVLLKMYEKVGKNMLIVKSKYIYWVRSFKKVYYYVFSFWRVGVLKFFELNFFMMGLGD